MLLLLLHPQVDVIIIPPDPDEPPVPTPSVIHDTPIKTYQGPFRVRVVSEPIVYLGNIYTKGDELEMPRDSIYEDYNYLGKVERVSGFDIPGEN